jgi:cardiolipin synthase
MCRAETDVKLQYALNVRLLVQPGDGVTALLKGIESAKASVDIVIFRFDRNEVERALANAVGRGVSVQALVAHMNRAGEDGLRDLEMRLLAAGVTVSRTAGDLVRYHGKLMIVDRRELYLLAFNFTYQDIEHSRSFGIVTTNRTVVQEAVRLFEADTKRIPYTPASSALVVSPVNARKQLAAFIAAAKSELLIYDPVISDPAMIRLLEERAKAGVDVKILGRLTRKSAKLAVFTKIPGLRLHTRTMIRDGRHAFIGSQSLREMELDARREVGIIFRDPKIVSRLAKTFHEDWHLAEQFKEHEKEDDGTPATRVAKKVAKAVAKELPPVGPVLEQIMNRMEGENTGLNLLPQEVEASVKDAVKTAVKEVVMDAMRDAAEPGPESEEDE